LSITADRERFFPATRSMPRTTSRDRVSEVFILVFILPLYYLWKTGGNGVRNPFIIEGEMVSEMVSGTILLSKEGNGVRAIGCGYGRNSAINGS